MEHGGVGWGGVLNQMWTGLEAWTGGGGIPKIPKFVRATFMDDIFFVKHNNKCYLVLSH